MNKHLSEIEYKVLNMLQEYSHCSPATVWEINKRKNIVIMDVIEYYNIVNVLKKNGYIIQTKCFFGESVETVDDSKVNTFHYTHLEASWLGMIKKK